MKVGIVGLGVVGMGQVSMFGEHVTATYDPSVHTSYPDVAFKLCDFIVICVGTPQAGDGSANLSQLARAVVDTPEGVPVVVRSTVPPGTTDRLLKGTGHRLYAHAPEFMGESVLHSWQRPQDVPYMLIGGDPESTVFFRDKFRRVFPGTIHTCSAKESELAKYAANLYWAARVTFINELALICDHFDVDYENVRRAWLQDPRMTDVYTQRAGYPPGFDGRCWPKDLAALVAASDSVGYDAGFLRAIGEANERFRDV